MWREICGCLLVLPVAVMRSRFFFTTFLTSKFVAPSIESSLVLAKYKYGALGLVNLALESAQN